MSVTLVTCFYKFKSKHNFGNYIIWINKFVNEIDCNMIIFTNKDMKKLITKLIKKKEKNIIFVEKDFNNLEILKEYKEDFWIKQYQLDSPCQHGNRTKECYIIWNSKFNFLKEAIELNPFKSDKFIWNDIGSLRENKDVKNYPKYTNISSDKLDIVILNSFPKKILDKEMFFRDQVIFSGAIFGGGKDVILKLYEEYYKIFKKYIEKDLFIGCDQQLIISMYLLNHQFFNIINNKDWFYLYDYYSL